MLSLAEGRFGEHHHSHVSNRDEQCDVSRGYGSMHPSQLVYGTKRRGKNIAHLLKTGTI